MSRSPSSDTYAEHYKKKLLAPDELEKRVAEWRRDRKTIATLNGSFDLLHAGHLEILYQASLQGDILLVALNSDSSIQKYKSPLRPIIPLEQRLQMIAALDMVDYITWFEETDPRALLEKIKPDVHVNGAEYGAECIEAEVVRAHGGRIHMVERVTNQPLLCTSHIIQKIKATCV